MKVISKFETGLKIHLLIAHKTEAGWDRTEWTNVKATAEFQEGFAFPNLPYLVDGDVKISQSTAMLKYIARKFDIGQKLNDTGIHLIRIATI